jgi:integrase
VPKRLPYISSYKSRHGKLYYRFRRKGYEPHTFKEPYGTKAFEREYATCLERDPKPAGTGRTIPGSVSDTIIRYYQDNAFKDLRGSTQAVYRGVLENFRADFGHDPMRAFDAQRVAKLMNVMRHKPHAAARLRKLLRSLFSIARREQLVPYDFDPIKDTSPPKAPAGGYHRWTEDEMEQYENCHPLGTKQRLTFALLLWGAQRSVDVRFMTRETIEGGRIKLLQSKTSNDVDVMVMPELQEALDAGPLGEETLLEANTGEPYTPKGFYNMFKRACIKAGLPHCSAHGLRKSAARRCYLAGCSDEEGMQITGHKTLAEYRRYAGIGQAKPEMADAAAAKVMANRSRQLDTRAAETRRKAGEIS